MPSFSEIRLSTARLELRPFQERDEQALFDIHSNPAFMRYWSSPTWATAEEGVKMIARDQRDMAEGIDLRLAIVLRQDSRPDRNVRAPNRPAVQARRTGLRDRPDVLAARIHVRSPIRADRPRLSRLNRNRIEADIDPRNTASAKSLQKLGFIEEGFLRQRRVVGEEVFGSALYGSLAQDWRCGGARADA